MTSSINPNNIDGTYPVAGQDNNSQGFRNNFTNTKTNFGYAADEITDLQNKAVLKAALTGGTVNNALGNVAMSGGVYNGYALQRVDLASVSGAVTVNVFTAPIQTMTLSGNASLGFTGWSTSGVYASVTVIVNMTAGQTLTFPANINPVDQQGIAGVTPVGPGVANPFYTAAYATTVSFVFSSTTAGLIEIGLDVASPTNFAANGGTQSIVVSGTAVSLIRTATSFALTTPGTATLGIGMNGQFKTLVNTNGVDVIITVATPGWGGAGTVTLENRGTGCTLQYINGAWWCIGNNGATII
jgi:hypothetical protein